MDKRQVLLVGGDSGVVSLIRDYLRLSHREDYEVESIEYCDDALATLLRRPFDLVLLLSLRVPWRTWPSLSSPARHIGSESAILFLKQMRGLHKPTPVILVSGASQAYLAEALVSGASAVLGKPFMFTELEDALGAVSRPSEDDRRLRD